ncbi:MAG: hypothetical protein V5A24_08625, partial [Haloarculaceae archaeon]
MTRPVDRRTVLASVGTVLVAGCSGGGGDGSGGNDGGSGENGGGGGGGEDATPASVSCSDFASSPFVPYDVAGTAFPCTFEYPELLAITSKIGDPVGILQFQRQVGDGAVLLNVQLGSHDGYTADTVTSIYSEAASFDYGDRNGYVVRVQEPVVDIPTSQFSVEIPWETVDGVLYYGVAFSGQF